MNYLKRQETARIVSKDDEEIIVHVRPDTDDPLVFKFFNIIPGMYYISPANRPPGYIDPDELPDRKNPHYLGRILFDGEGNWVYDGDQFTPAEQERLASFIINQ